MADERQAGLCGAILNCALPTNHDGLHERADGIRWSWHENIDHLPTPASERADERQAGLREALELLRAEGQTTIEHRTECAKVGPYGGFGLGGGSRSGYSCTCDQPERQAIIDRALAALAAPAQEERLDVERVSHDDWPGGISDGLTLPCPDCGMVPEFGFHVADAFWRRWVPGDDRLGVMCLPCLDRRCGGIGLAAALEEIQWTGTGHTVVLHPTRRVEYEPRRALGVESS